MRIRVLAVGTRMPPWVVAGVSEYGKRLPRDFRVEWVEIAPAKRQGDNSDKFKAQEAIALSKQIKDDDTVVALDVQGSLVRTEDMAESFSISQRKGASMAILIGGPDGIDADLLTIDPTTGVVSMIARDFENPDDNNANNFYNLIG